MAVCGKLRPKMKRQMETELAQAKLSTPCRKALESLQEHWEGVDPIRGRFTDPDGQQRLGTTCAWGRRWRWKNFYGSGSQWSGQLAAAAFSTFATLSKWKALILGNG